MFPLLMIITISAVLYPIFNNLIDKMPVNKKESAEDILKEIRDYERFKFIRDLNDK